MSYPKNKTSGRLAIFAAALLLLAGIGWGGRAQAQTRDPVRKVVAYDLDVTGAAAICTTALSVSKTTGALRITVALNTTDSVFNVQVINASPAKTYTLKLNSGTALTAGNLYTFTIGVDSGYTYNLTCTTTTKIAYLLVEESTSDGL